MTASGSDAVDARRRFLCAMVGLFHSTVEASIGEVGMIGLDLAKHVFQVHGADASDRPVLRKRLRRGQVLEFFSRQLRCVVAMEACSGAHFWGQEIAKLGHEVRLVPPAYVKPFVKRQKNDMADAEATAEAAQRPTMRFVASKSKETQGAAAVFRVRELLIRPRTQAINALRGHMAEFGEVVPQGTVNARRLAALIEAESTALPATMRASLSVLVSMLLQLEEKVAELDVEIARRAREDETARRLMTVPGIGPLIATALATLAPPPEMFRRGRDFAAWVGLTPGSIHRRQAAPRCHDQGG